MPVQRRCAGAFEQIIAHRLIYRGFDGLLVEDPLRAPFLADDERLDIEYLRRRYRA